MFDGAVLFAYLERYLVRRRKCRGVHLFKARLDDAVGDSRCLNEAILALVSFPFFGTSDVGRAGVSWTRDDKARWMNNVAFRNWVLDGNLRLQATSSGNNVASSNGVSQTLHQSRLSRLEFMDYVGPRRDAELLILDEEVRHVGGIVGGRVVGDARRRMKTAGLLQDRKGRT